MPISIKNSIISESWPYCFRDALHGGRCAEETAGPAAATTIHNNRLQGRGFVPGQQESLKLELFCTQRCPFTSCSDPEPGGRLPEPPLGHTSNSHEGRGASRNSPAPTAATTNPAPGHGEMPPTRSISSLHWWHFQCQNPLQCVIQTAPWPISELPNRMSCHIIFICTALQMLESCLGGWAKLDADLKELWPLYHLLPWFLIASQGILWPLSSDLEAGLMSNPSTLPFFFCFALFLIYFGGEGQEKPGPSYSSNCVRPGSSWRSKWKHFPGFGTHPSGSRCGGGYFCQGKGAFKSHQNILPGKSESESPQLLLPLPTISHWKRWFSLLVPGRVRAGDGEGIGGTSTAVTGSHHPPV